MQERPTGTARSWFNLGVWAGAGGALLTLACLAAEYGFPEDRSYRTAWHAGQVVAFLLVWVGKLYAWLAPSRRLHWPRLALDVSLLTLLLIALAAGPGLLARYSPTAVRWSAFHAYLLITVLVYVGRFSVAAAAAGRSPARTLILSFAAAIFIGGIMLLVPAAHQTAPLAFTDAIFTATSATCVTGLTAVNTADAYTRFGQAVILALIQAGGLGIMIFGTVFALLLGSRLSLRESTALQDILQETSPARIGRLAVFVCLVAAAIEAAGAVALSGLWEAVGPGGDRWFRSLFHAVSAFCNAGLSVEKENLAAYRLRPEVYLVIGPLIVLGGLGFPVLENLWRSAAYRGRRWGARRRGSVRESLRPERWTLHTKLVLGTTAVLLAGGAAVLALLEWARPFPTTPWTPVRLLDAVFLSITSRTAGFSTLDVGSLSAASKLVLILLMFIGGSPSSTAGGVKTVTVAILFLTIYATMRRQQEVHVARRHIAAITIRRAATLIFLYGGLQWLLTLLLTITEHSRGQNFLDLLFEVTSALGTVGLSTGVTAGLTLPGKWVIIVAMFVGRVGPLSLLAALAVGARPRRFEYPEEPLLVG